MQKYRKQEIASWDADRILHNGVICEVRIPRYNDQQGQKLRARRHELGLGLRDAAKLANLSPSTLSKLETGELAGNIGPVLEAWKCSNRTRANESR